MERHECLRCVYSVLGQITHTKVRQMEDTFQNQHNSALSEHRIINPPSKRRNSKTLPPTAAPLHTNGEAATRTDPLVTGGGSCERNALSLGLRETRRRNLSADDGRGSPNGSARQTQIESLASPSGRGLRRTKSGNDEISMGGAGIGAVGLGIRTLSHDRLQEDVGTRTLSPHASRPGGARGRPTSASGNWGSPVPQRGAGAPFQTRGWNSLTSEGGGVRSAPRPPPRAGRTGCRCLLGTEGYIGRRRSGRV